MSHFSELVQIGRWPSAREDQEYARQQFPAVVAQSRLHLWSPGDPIPREGTCLLIGVATYSREDLRLLDLVEEALKHQDGTGPRVDVFNTLDCRTDEDFARYVPGLGKVHQTPVVGVWEKGVLKEKAWGKPARDLVIQICGLHAPAGQSQS